MRRRKNTNLLNQLLWRLLRAPRFWGFFIILLLMLYIFMPHEKVGRLLMPFTANDWAKSLYAVKYEYFPNSDAPPLSGLLQAESSVIQKEEKPTVVDRELAAANEEKSWVLDESFAFPASTVPCTVVRHKAFALCYDEEHELARWVAYRLDYEELEGNLERLNNFAPDPAVPTGTAHPSDYSRTGYDRGHLAAAADFEFDRQAYEESFLMSNIAPQTPELNRGVWRELEEQCRRWVRRDKSLYIVTGPILGKRPRKIGKRTKISVPEAFYKVILDMREPEIKAIAFIMPNSKNLKDDFMDYVVSIDEVEAQTGLDFFPELSKNPALEQRLEGELHPELWRRKYRKKQ
ncbi:endonuclease G [Thermonema lapsum]|uniref:Endonuclease n=1 Tax=Thermonema lapsum TaxID=28195 RepID=A0A846MNK0_9BACT|nr:DNA/RNA non-specific endonuclease [Thermonema lapsum]NIK72927.1 endonuclease G [Thermonema lapsum]